MTVIAIRFEEEGDTCSDCARLAACAKAVQRFNLWDDEGSSPGTEPWSFYRQRVCFVVKTAKRSCGP
jgi:hypothetical protein